MSNALWELPEESKAFCSVETLEFRAACNEVVNETDRPVKRRVIARIAASQDGKRLIYSAWMYKLNDVAMESDRAARVSERLVQDPGWRTLVREEVERERYWGDLIHGKFKVVWDRLSSLWEKLCDPEHPVARGTTGAILTLLAFWIPYNVAPIAVKNFTEPIRVIFTGESTPLHAQFVAENDGKPIPVTFVPRIDPDVLPLQFTSSKTLVPLTFGVDSKSGTQRPSAEDMGALVKATNDLHTIAQGITSLSGPPPQASKLASPSSAVGKNPPRGEVPEMIEEFQNATKTLTSVLDNQSALENKLRNIELVQTKLEEAERNRTGAMTIALTEDVPHSVAIEWFDPVSGATVCTVDFEARKIEKIVRVSASPKLCSPKRLQLKAMVADLSIGVPWNADLVGCTVTVDEVEKHRFAKKYVIVTIVPYSFSAVGTGAIAPVSSEAIAKK